MKKIISLLMILALLSIVNAQQTIQVNKGIDQSLGAIHDFDLMFEQIQLLLTQNKIKRIELKINYLNERIAELEEVSNKKPKFISKAMLELQSNTDSLAKEADVTPKPMKERVEFGLENSKNILLSIKTRFESDDNTNNDNAIKGIETAINSHITAISKIDSEKDKDEVEVRQKGKNTIVKAVVGNQEIEYEVLGAQPIEVVINDLNNRVGKKVNTDNIKVNGKKI